MSARSIGLVGLSDTGPFLARCLARHGWTVIVYDADERLREEFYEHSDISVAHSLVNLGRLTQTVICTLPNARAIREAVLGNAQSSGLLATMRPGGLLIDCTPSRPDDANSLTRVVESLGHDVVDAPSQGNIRAAAMGSMRFSLSGNTAAIERAEPILRCLGSIETAGSSGDARVLETLQNAIAAATIAATCDALSLGRKLGLDEATLARLLEDPLAQTGVRDRLQVRRPLAQSPRPVALHTVTSGLQTSCQLARQTGEHAPTLERVEPVLTAASTALSPRADLPDLAEWLANQMPSTPRQPAEPHKTATLTGGKQQPAENEETWPIAAE